MENYIKIAKENVWLPYTQMQNAVEQLEVESTFGCEIRLKNGDILIDGISSWWSVAHGYNHPKIVTALKKQVETLPHIMMAGLANEETYKLAYNLVKITPSGLNKVFFSDSGSTAVEIAMKIAVQYFINKKQPKRNKFVSFKNSYHGDTMGAMSLADLTSGMHKKFQTYLPKNFNLKLPQNIDDLNKFEDFLVANKQQIAGLFIEPLVQCSAGMKFHKAEIVRHIYDICQRNQILFIADECAVAFYRTGKFFACDHCNITPDILTIGKALTGGFLKMAATLTKDFIYEEFLSNDLDNALMHGPTFMGNPLAASAANASIDLFLNNNYQKKVEKIQKIMSSKLNDLIKLKKVIDVRVIGAIAAIEINTNWEEILYMRQYFPKNGVWLRPIANVIYIMPPLVISEQELLKIISTIKKYLTND